jgi:hypothetical protein
MQPQSEVRSVQVNGVSTVGAFGMKAENSAHIFGILRNQLYSNKVLAVLREYSANAWDEHRAAGIPDRPIKVVLPTALDPTLRIRDYGRGLSEKDVFDVYTQYGSSTKRQSDDVVGCLGIGSKSAFAYADTFTVTSWYEGQKSIYVAVLDVSNVGTMSLLWRGPCDPTETGVEVSMPVSVADCPAFLREAGNLYPYFSPVPDINIPIRAIPNADHSVHGDLNTSGRYPGWIAVMGCIPYVIDMDQLRDDLYAANLHDVCRANGFLRFNIGEVRIAASREALEYTVHTKEAIIRRVQALVTDLSRKVVEIVADDAIPPWTRRILVRPYLECVTQFSHSDVEPWLLYEVNLYDALRTDENPTRTATSFELRRLHTSKSSITSDNQIRVVPDARIVIRDVKYPPACCGVTSDDRIVYPRTGFTVDAVRAELDLCLAGVNLTGIPIVRMSSLPYTPKVRNTIKSGTSTPDKKVRHFVLKTPNAFPYRHNNPSGNWVGVTRTPTDDDLFVVLEGFVPKGMVRNAYRSIVSSDRRIATWLGITFPPIYGYRTSVQHPVYSELCIGRHYPDVRMDVLRDMLEANPERRAELERFAWGRAQSSLGGYGRIPELLKAVQVLPDGHIIRVLVERIVAAMQWVGLQSSDACRNLFEAYGVFVDIVTFEAQTSLHAVFDRYPHLNPNNAGPGIQSLTRPLWIDYVNLIDKVNP